MAKVYRLEWEGRGIYFQYWFKYIEVNEFDKHPGPETDVKLRRRLDEKGITLGSNILFGFNSISQYKRWVYLKKWRKEMSENGVQLKVFEVPNTSRWIGNSQVVFNRSEAKEIDILDPFTLESILLTALI